MTHDEKVAFLKSYDFVVGARDPKLNTDYPGKYMVAEEYTRLLTTTKNGENGPWCIVGDDLAALVDEAFDHLDSQL